MRRTLKFGIITLAVAGLSGMAGAATAAFGTFSFTNFGSVTFTDTPSGNVLGPTTTQVVLPLQAINGIDPTYLGNVNSFCNTTDCPTGGPDPNGQLHLLQTLLFLGGSNTINIAGSAASPISFQFSGGTTPADRYEFDSLLTGGIVVASPGSLQIIYDGNFSDSGGFFNSQAARVSFTFTQSSAGASVGESASFSTPPVPEPASMALIGGGLVAIGLLARKKRKA